MMFSMGVAVDVLVEMLFFMGMFVEMLVEVLFFVGVIRGDALHESGCVPRCLMGVAVNKAAASEMIDQKPCA